MFKFLPSDTVYAYPNASVLGNRACLDALEASGPQTEWGGPTALYIHVPFCASLCQFCGFAKSIDVRRHVLNRFTDEVCAEIDLMTSHFGLSKRAISAVYFGGGTASVLSPGQIERILTALRGAFHILDDAEMTFEGECRTLSRKGYLSDIRSLGFRRISFGAQTMDAPFRDILNLKPAIADLARLREEGEALFDEVCIDFIYGWPGLGLDHFRNDLDALLDIVNPSSVELFRFEKLESSPMFLQAMYAHGLKDLPTDVLVDQHRHARERFADAGFEQVSYSKFAKPGISSTYTYGGCFYGYDNGNVIGFGRGAQTFLDGRMWSFGLPEQEHADLLHRNVPPIGIFATYRPHEREAVSWPRRSFIAADRVPAYRDPEYIARLRVLEREGYIFHDGQRYRLTEIGRDWVPNLIHYIMPYAQRRHFRRDEWQSLLEGRCHDGAQQEQISVQLRDRLQQDYSAIYV
ncbi:radical SAM protein [Breoghania sp.]|uniref:coproporphyrinogen-III oxidase family protein n=1 Tax=Breoghania sp. TaxID=2065378 RepID=UPI0029CA281A|nr:radical SAM protein [Breoghania sp.]